MVEEGEGNEKYFQSYEDVEIHRLMLEDKPRTEAYREAILENAALFKDKVVMDVGAGTGILSLFAAQAGAKKVYAVEASSISEPLSKIVELNNKGKVIEVVRGRVEDAVIPEKVDIIISEWMGFYLLHESMLDSVIAARDKHLDPNDGLVFPTYAVVRVAPAFIQSTLSSDKDYWKDVYGFDMSPMMESVCSKPLIQYVRESDLLADSKVLIELDLRWTTKEEVSELYKRELFTSLKEGRFNSLILWFDVKFDPCIFEDIDVHPVSLSTGPGQPETHWKQTIIPINENIEVQKGDKILYDIYLCQSEKNPRQYTIELQMLDSKDEENHPIPCHCDAYRCASALELLKALEGKDEDDE